MKKPPGASPYFGVFRELDLEAVRPRGWLQAWLQRQADGLTGHLEHAGYPFHTDGWRLDPIPPRPGFGSAWWPYEQYAYWVDGLARAGALLRDRLLLAKATRQLEHVLNHPDRDGYLGPKALKRLTPEGRNERWPHAVLFRALLGTRPAPQCARDLRKLTRHYLSRTADHASHRNLCNLEIMLRVYERTGDRRLLDLARGAFRAFNRRFPEAPASLKNLRSRAPAKDHGVNYCELSKLPAILYLYTGRRDLLDAARQAYTRLEQYHGLADGVPSSTEHLAGRAAEAGHETCVIADYTWSLGYLLRATGEARWADRIEQAVFNAAPGATRPDFKALQYFSSPNQIVADATGNHHPHGFGWAHKSYRPNPATECCPGNVTRILPNYIARQWMARADGGMAAVLYGPGEVRFTAGRPRRPVRVVQETDYPFGERIVFRFNLEHPVRFAFSMRIPGWCRRARLRVRGRKLGGEFPEVGRVGSTRRERGGLGQAALPAGTLVTLRRTFCDGDRVELELPMPVVCRRHSGGVVISRGPLLYALPVAARRWRDRKDRRSSDEFPAWNFRPAGPWNYALVREAGRRRRGSSALQYSTKFPMVGKNAAGFSKHWKKWKAIFPNIGKNKADFSKHWKNTAHIFQTLEKNPGSFSKDWKKNFPWGGRRPPSVIFVPAVRVPGWRARRRRVIRDKWHGTRRGDFFMTPPLPSRAALKKTSRRVEWIPLVPYGCTPLRIAVFPEA